MIATARSVIGLCWIAFVVVWVLAARGTKRTMRQPKNQFVYRIFWLGGFVLLFLSHPRQRSIPFLTTPAVHASSGIAAFGLLFVLAGLALAFWARATLGANWSGQITLKENHTLVSNGPYAIVRHPIYTAILSMFLGTALAYGTRGAFLAFPVCAIGFVIKARQEEALMIATFPDAYPAYRARTKMIVPGVF